MSLANITQEEWTAFKASVRQQVNQIIIPVDVNPGMVKAILAQIDTLHTNVRMEYSDLEGKKEYLEILIREVERSSIEGSNELARKKAATVAVQNYPGANGQVINLYDYQRRVLERYNFLKGILDVLFSKQNRLITVNGILKLEQGTMPYDVQG